VTQVAPLQLSIFSFERTHRLAHCSPVFPAPTLGHYQKVARIQEKLKDPKLSLRVLLSSRCLLPSFQYTQKESETLVSAGRRSVGVPAKGFCSLMLCHLKFIFASLHRLFISDIITVPHKPVTLQQEFSRIFLPLCFVPYCLL